MPHLSPTTLTSDERRLILRATAGNLRDHVMFSLDLGTGLRLAEIVGLDVGDVYGPGGVPKARVRVRREIAKGGRAADVFLPDRLVTKLKRFWRWKRKRGEELSADAPRFANQSRTRISRRRVQHALAWDTRGFPKRWWLDPLEVSPPSGKACSPCSIMVPNPDCCADLDRTDDITYRRAGGVEPDVWGRRAPTPALTSTALVVPLALARATLGVGATRGSGRAACGAAH
jgi:hypothetical protein